MKVHAVKSTNHNNKIKVRETSCYCSNSYDDANLCERWREAELVRGRRQQAGKSSKYFFALTL